jgi:hypothetical protein
MGLSSFLVAPGLSALIGGVGFLTVDFAGGGASHHGGGFAVDDHPEVVEVRGDYRYQIPGLLQSEDYPSGVIERTSGAVGCCRSLGGA